MRISASVNARLYLLGEPLDGTVYQPEVQIMEVRTF